MHTIAPPSAFSRSGGALFARLELREQERAAFCSRLAEAVLSRYRVRLLMNLVKKRYFYFTASEQEEIMWIAQSYQNCKIRLGEDRFQEELSDRLNRFLEHSRALNVEGFVRFRMRDYTDRLEETVDRAAEDYLIDREYKEFIGLLTSLVEFQPCLTEQVHVLPEGEAYRLLGSAGEGLPAEDGEQPFGPLSQDDWLLSRLITLSPRSIVIHSREKMKNRELLNTLRNIFGEKLTFCPGCPLCPKN